MLGAMHYFTCLFTVFITAIIEHFAWLWNTNKCDRISFFENISHILKMETKNVYKWLQVYLTDTIIKGTKLALKEIS